jgi:alpha-amylase
MEKVIIDVKQTICLLFMVHQPYRLKPYRFFDIGMDHSYFNESQNADILKKMVSKCYLPVNEALMNLIRKFGGAFKVAFSISGTTLEQMQKYTPEAIDSFKELYQTGNVEFVAEPFSHSMALLSEKLEFCRQVEKQRKMLHCIFNCTPTALINTNLLYSNDLAKLAHNMGFNSVIIESAKEVLNWRSSNYVYTSEPHPELKLVLRNSQLSEDISVRFSQREWSEWPLSPEKFMNWLNAINRRESLVNLFLDYGMLFEYQNIKAGILGFLNVLTEKIVTSKRWLFSTVSEAVETIQPIAALNVPQAGLASENDEHLTIMLENELQQDAFSSLYSLAPLMLNCKDRALRADWSKLQTSDHFYYMNIKHNKGSKQLFSPYSTPFEAFLNYMNVLADFRIRVMEYRNRNVVTVK